MEQSALDIVRIIGSVFKFGRVSNPNISKCINNSKVTGHHAIIPTANISAADLNSLPMTERNILDLIANRLLCASALPHKYESVKISAICNNAEFSANGKSVLEKGWKQYALKTSDDGESKTLPQITERQQFAVTTSKSFCRTMYRACWD